MDIDKGIRVLHGDFKTPELITKINPTFKEAMEYIDAIQTTHKTYSFDIEVTGMETACIGLGFSPTEAMCINFRNQRENVYCRTGVQTFTALCRNEPRPNNFLYCTEWKL
jgi:hypothetical protein